jgi:hypothetical protein
MTHLIVSSTIVYYIVMLLVLVRSKSRKDIKLRVGGDGVEKQTEFLQW